MTELNTKQKHSNSFGECACHVCVCRWLGEGRWEGRLQKYDGFQSQVTMT